MAYVCIRGSETWLAILRLPQPVHLLLHRCFQFLRISHRSDDLRFELLLFLLSVLLAHWWLLLIRFLWLINWDCHLLNLVRLRLLVLMLLLLLTRSK